MNILELKRSARGYFYREGGDEQNYPTALASTLGSYQGDDASRYGAAATYAGYTPEQLNVSAWKPSSEWSFDPKNRYVGTNITLGDGSVVPYDAIVAQVKYKYDADKKNPTLAVKSGIQLGIPDEVLMTLPGVDSGALKAGHALIDSGAFASTAINEADKGGALPAPVGSVMYNARIAAGLDAYGHPSAQVATAGYTPEQIASAINTSRQQGFSEADVAIGLSRFLSSPAAVAAALAANPINNASTPAPVVPAAGVAKNGPSAGQQLAAVMGKTGGGGPNVDIPITEYIEAYQSVNPDGTINRYDTQGNFVTTYTSNGSDIVGDFFAGIDSSLGLSKGLTSIGKGLEDLDNTLGLSKNAPAIVGFAASYFLPGIGQALGQSLVNAGVITGAAIPYATTIGTALAQTGVSVAQGKPLDQALGDAILSGGMSELTQAYGSRVKSAIGQITDNPIAQKAIFKAGTDVVTAVAQGKSGDQVLQGIGKSVVSTVAGEAANELVKNIPGINSLPDAAKKVVTSGIATSIQGGDGTKSMLDTALREGTNYVLDAVTSTPIAPGTAGTTGAMQGGFGPGAVTPTPTPTPAPSITDTLTKTGLQETTPSPVAGIPAETTPITQGAVTGTALPPSGGTGIKGGAADASTGTNYVTPIKGGAADASTGTVVTNTTIADLQNAGLTEGKPGESNMAQTASQTGGTNTANVDPWGNLDAAIAASAKRAWPTNFSDSVAKSLDLFDQLESAGLTSNNGVTTIYDSRTKENLSFNADTGEFLGKTPAPPNSVVTDPEVQKFLNTIKPNVDAFPIGYKSPTPEAIQNTTPGATKNPIASTDKLVVDMLDSEDSANRNQPALDTASAAEQNLAALLAFGKTATPPPAGNSYALLGELSGSYGQNIPDYIGNLPFSLVSKDTGTGETSYSNGQGLSLVAYSDGTAKITEDAHPETPITVQLPPEVKDQPEIVLPPATKTIPPTPTPIPVTTPKPPVPPVTPPEPPKPAPPVPPVTPLVTPTVTPPVPVPTPAPTPTPPPTLTPTSPPPTSAEVSKIVTDALAANPSLTPKQVAEIVDNAVKTIPLGTTAADVQKIVDAAVKTIPAGPSAQDVSKAVTDATKNLATTGSVAAVEAKVTDAEQRISDAVQAAKDIGLKGDAALQAGLNTVAADLGKSKEALLAQLGKTEESLKTQFATDVGAVKAAVETGQAATKTALGELNEAQKKEVADRVAAGQATDAAIAAVKATVETGQAATEAKLDAQGKAFRDALVQQGMDQQTALETAMAAQTKLVTEGQAATKTALGDLSAAQQKEVADRVAAGQTTNAAIAAVKATVETGQAATQKALGELSTAQQKEVAARVAAGETTAAAIAAVKTTVETGQAALESKLTEQGKNFRDALVQQGMDQSQALETAIAAQTKLVAEGQSATKTAIGELSKAQQQEVIDRVAAGQKTDEAIAAVQKAVTIGQAETETKLDAQGKSFRDALIAQGMGQQQALETAIAAQTKLVAEGQNATNLRIDELVKQGMTYQQATQKAITEMSTGFTTQLTGAEKARQEQASAWEAQRQLDLTEAEKQRGIDRQAELDRAAAAGKARQIEITNQKAREAANLKTIQKGQIRGQMQTGLQGLIGGLQQQATQMAAPGVVETVKATPGFDFGSPLNVGFFGGYESQKSPTKNEESLKIATGGYLDDLLEAIR